MENGKKKSKHEIKTTKGENMRQSAGGWSKPGSSKPVSNEEHPPVVDVFGLLFAWK